jgi:hypothetical protein
MSQPESPYKFGVRQYIAVALLVAWAALLYGPPAVQRITPGLNAAYVLAMFALVFWPKRSRQRRSSRL